MGPHSMQNLNINHTLMNDRLYLHSLPHDTWFRGIFTFNQSKSLTVERTGENEPKEDYFLNEKGGKNLKKSTCG